MKKKVIAVLGAGPMGLATAFFLVKKGYKPIIYEADSKIGGMSASFNFSGEMLERFYHFHCVSDVKFLSVLDTLNLKKKLRWKKTKMGYWYKDLLQEWGTPIALLKFRGLSLFSKLRYAFHIYFCTKRKYADNLYKRKAIFWLIDNQGSEAYDVLWKQLFDFKFYSYKKTISAAWLWTRIRRIGTSRYNLFQEKLGYLIGGSSTLLNRMKVYIESRGGVFKLNQPVEKVIIKNNRVSGILVGGRFKKYDFVASTLPIPYIPKLIPSLPTETLRKFRAIKNIAVVCVVIKLNRKFTDNFWLNVSDKNMDIPGFIEYTNLRPLKYHYIYVPFYMPQSNKKYKDSNSIFIEKVKTYMMKINPLLVEKNFLSAHVNRYKYAQPICKTNFQKYIAPLKMPTAGLWIADTSSYFPFDRGISESFEVGEKIANEILYELSF
jgi:protoporphyrinogen oxidase